MKHTEDRFVIAFYNLENFFDTHDDPHTLDDDFTPEGRKAWNETRFRKKSKKLARTISLIGKDYSSEVPVLVGVAEVENKKALEAILKVKALKEVDYDYVHFDSPDERGIDTALIYHKSHFKVLDAETIPLMISNGDGERDYTRDILYVHGKLHEEEVHLFVNHWPSRRDGADETEHKRIKAAETVLRKIEGLQEENPNCIIMGDFNDDPNSPSIQRLMDSGRFVNPMQQLLSPKSGSANYKGEWSLFDQIILSHSFLNYEAGTHSFKMAKIFAPKFLKEWKGKYKGNPFRTFVGKKYLGGYSDHFPVYVVLKENN
ncbi:endonuclease/exonuclease/phosphatase family protein [Flagellimonas myxillae]|uniref:endonuclease/exonuclease/phosphatase family protein n=1 Tax=Flagellimonas myxillae TaxID=2942214 RepID=UPI00201E8792|nr:endonuclease/exonuclease/phosphatase family protein [Muricauda myxillae]MCL6266780.1 endonuclease [Muricauda myxillae]